MSSRRTSLLYVLFTVLITLVLTIVPLPQTLNYGRPDWLLLVVIYWSLNTPMLAGLTFAWLCGLALDVLIGSLIGQHALAFVLVATITHRLQLRMRIFPVLHQAATVLMLLVVYEFLIFWIDGIIGNANASWLRWLPALTSAVLWPVLVAVLDTANRRMR